MSLKDRRDYGVSVVEDLIADAKLLLTNAKKAKNVMSSIDSENVDSKIGELETLLGDSQYKYIILDGDAL